MSGLYNDAAAWCSEDLINDHSWVFQLDDDTRNKLAQATKKVFDPDRALFDYTMDEFGLWQEIEPISQAAQMAHVGTGLALVKGLPRDQLNEKEFELLVWAIGLCQQ